MDDTLLNGRTIFAFAREKGFTNELLSIIQSKKQSFEKSIEIAKLLKGMKGSELLQIFRSIHIREHVENVIEEIKKKDIITGIATNSYQFVADDLKRRLDIDYAFANNLIMNKDIVTGEIILNNQKKLRCDGGIIYSICKGYVLEQLCKRLNISIEEAIAVGDGRVDLGMIKKAGLGIAFNAPDEVKSQADLYTSNMRVILDYI
jgi:phosphoserine phosphatase